MRCARTDCFAGGPKELRAMRRDGLAHRPPRGPACEAQGRGPARGTACDGQGRGPPQGTACDAQGRGPPRGTACDAQKPCTSHERKFTEKCRAMRRGRAHRKNVLQALFFGDVLMSALINQRNSLFLRCARALHIARLSLAEGGPCDAHLFGSLWILQK